MGGSCWYTVEGKIQHRNQQYRICKVFFEAIHSCVLLTGLDNVKSGSFGNALALSRPGLECLSILALAALLMFEMFGSESIHIELPKSSVPGVRTSKTRIRKISSWRYLYKRVLHTSYSSPIAIKENTSSTPAQSFVPQKSSKNAE